MTSATCSAPTAIDSDTQIHIELGQYSWPHKFYIETPCEPYRCCISSTSGGGKETTYTYGERRTEYRKFYTEHLIDATPEQIAEWNRVVKPLTGIGFVIENDDLKYFAPRHGWQDHGIIAPPASV